MIWLDKAEIAERLRRMETCSNRELPALLRQLQDDGLFLNLETGGCGDYNLQFRVLVTKNEKTEEFVLVGATIANHGGLKRVEHYWSNCDPSSRSFIGDFRAQANNLVEGISATLYLFQKSHPDFQLRLKKKEVDVQGESESPRRVVRFEWSKSISVGE